MEYWGDIQKEIEKKSVKINESISNVGFSSLLKNKNNNTEATSGDQTAGNKNTNYSSIMILKTNPSQASQSLQKNTSIDQFN